MSCDAPDRGQRSVPGPADRDGFRRELRRLIETAIGFADGDAGAVVVISIPDWGVTPFAPDGLREQVAVEIDAFNRVVGEEAAAEGVRFADVTAISREAAADRGLLAGEGLHTSGSMCRRWVEAILPAAREAITAR